ncbi:hypothetical protein LRP88_13521 [Fusarium phalaenopsidis]
MTRPHHVPHPTRLCSTLPAETIMESPHWLQGTVPFAQAQLIGYFCYAPETRSLFPASQANESRLQVPSCGGRAHSSFETGCLGRFALAKVAHQFHHTRLVFVAGANFQWPPLTSSSPPPSRQPDATSSQQNQSQPPAGLFASWAGTGWQTASSPYVPDSLQKWSSSFCLLENLVKPPPDSFASRSYRNARLLVSAHQRNKTRKSRKTSMVSLFGPDTAHPPALVLSFSAFRVSTTSYPRAPGGLAHASEPKGFPLVSLAIRNFRAFSPPISPHLSFLPLPPLLALCSAAAAAFMSSISVPQAEKAPCVLH